MKEEINFNEFVIRAFEKRLKEKFAFQFKEMENLTIEKYEESMKALGMNDFKVKIEIEPKIKVELVGLRYSPNPLKHLKTQEKIK